jgi:hypothetical protein
LGDPSRLTTLQVVDTALDARFVAGVRARVRGVTLPEVWAICAVALPVLGAVAASLGMTDLGYQLRAGQSMLSSGHLLHTDSMSFVSAGHHWVNQQWGAQILLDLAYKVGGFDGLVFLRALLVGVTFALVYRICRRAGATQRVAAGLTLGSFVVAVPNLALRPQLFGVLFFISTLAIVQRRRERPELLWAIPLLSVLWANVHGTFFLAPLLVGLAWLEDRRDRWEGSARTFLIGAISVAAISLNPYGLKVWSYAIGLSTNPVVTRQIIEWKPPTIHDSAGLLFFLSVGAVIGVLARRTERMRWPSLIALGVFLVLGLDALRGTVWWALAVPGLLAPLFAVRANQTAAQRFIGGAGRSRVNLAILGLLGVLIVSALPWWHQQNPFLPTRSLLSSAPTGISGELGKVVRPGARVVVPQPWGSWFEFEDPQLPVFVDSRIELYSARVWDDYQLLMAGAANWEKVLDRWKVRAVVTDHKQLPRLAPLLRHSDQWRLAYRDADGSIFLRVNPETAVTR